MELYRIFLRLCVVYARLFLSFALSLACYCFWCLSCYPIMVSGCILTRALSNFIHSTLEYYVKNGGEKRIELTSCIIHVRSDLHRVPSLSISFHFAIAYCFLFLLLVSRVLLFFITVSLFRATLLGFGMEVLQQYGYCWIETSDTNNNNGLWSMIFDY